MSSTTLPVRRSGAAHWWHGYGAMLRWELTNMRLLLPITVFAQIISGAGLVLGFGLLYPDIPDQAAAFLSTGAVVITLLIVGLILGPQLVVQQKQAGTYDFMWSLPVPRSAASAAWTTLNLILALPGMMAALLVAVWRYDLSFAMRPSVVAAVGLTLVTGTLLGYAMAHAVPHPEITQLATQVLIFGIIGFSPISFPAENLPSWLAATHRYLPFESMAITIRGALLEGYDQPVARAYVVLVAWMVAAAGISAWALVRRK